MTMKNKTKQKTSAIKTITTSSITISIRKEVIKNLGNIL